ncbi:hypothetical protein [Botrimarina hoheduenensis]|uniref:hypothetical protein n=1 Tax=Botrimarina hoheduenensis TaxID=2528000 RepID=UPI0018D36DFA|nr:hypothetical protein [Botrimarina hoheduenensis]
MTGGWADPVATAIARVLATRRIVVPFTPIGFPIAAATATTTATAAAATAAATATVASAAATIPARAAQGAEQTTHLAHNTADTERHATQHTAAATPSDTATARRCHATAGFAAATGLTSTTGLHGARGFAAAARSAIIRAEFSRPMAPATTPPLACHRPAGNTTAARADPATGLDATAGFHPTTGFHATTAAATAYNRTPGGQC